MKIKDDDDLPFGVGVFLNAIVVALMIIAILFFGLLHQYIIEPYTGEEKALDIYVFFTLPTSMFIGAVIGKAIVMYYIYPAWKKRQNNP